LADALRLERVELEQVGADVLIRGYPAQKFLIDPKKRSEKEIVQEVTDLSYTLVG
jgi:hypothetical protein